MTEIAPVLRGDTFVFDAWNAGKMSNSMLQKPSISTLAGKEWLLYNVCIPVDYAYSTLIGIRPLK